MFFFRKKNQSTDAPANTIKRAVIRPELRVKIERLKNELEVANGDLRTKILNELGSSLFALQETDAAIQYYELSIQENRSLGKAYTDLLKLYNIKRKDAALSNDDKQVQQYLNKIDDLMKLSKDVIRGLD
ncbi:Hypothetical protein LUCI_2363 [Lucifera butyrica]|uniref:Tetratricopeptide repeat n=1 Tax=Lucifera butyrica TaxID=1351585 RepID=A0A498R7C5_9FIRM|nr:hypothetical protein [Lucifera butyrica]VBB07119.1 Hypothetical protein LUCI_2363 [Lucifera butyrica]